MKGVTKRKKKTEDQTDRGLILARRKANFAGPRQKESLIRRPRFFIRRPKGLFTAFITPIESRIRRPNFRNSPQAFRRPSKSKAKPLNRTYQEHYSCFEEHFRKTVSPTKRIRSKAWSINKTFWKINRNKIDYLPSHHIQITLIINIIFVYRN